MINYEGFFFPFKTRLAKVRWVKRELCIRGKKNHEKKLITKFLPCLKDFLCSFDL